MEVNYLLEGHQGETVNILTGRCDGSGDSFIHSVVRESDSTELCRLRMSWKENGQ